jgi:phosphoribosylanthranilate isomerase
MKKLPVKLKVCGLKYRENVDQLLHLAPDYVGFIFYPESTRFVGTGPESDFIKHIPNNIKKVGVFVDASTEEILEICNKYHIDTVQLHGNESIKQCKEIKNKCLKIIKAFSICPKFDFDALQEYKQVTDYYLFDTKGEKQGGNGYAFDWAVLEHYDNDKPFFLSGGISLENIGHVYDLLHLNIYGLDVNSCFESSPGMKDLGRIKTLKESYIL